MSGLDFLLDPEKGGASEWEWATVTSVSPLRIRIDGDSQPLTGAPLSLVNRDRLILSARVRVQFDRSNQMGQSGARPIIVGLAGGADTAIAHPALPVGTTFTIWYDGGWPPRPTSLRTVVVQWCSVNYQGIPPTAEAGIDFLRIMEYQPIPDPDPGPGVDEDGTVLASYTFEDDTNGVAISPSGAWSNFGTGASFLASTAAAVHGSLGGRITVTEGTRALRWTKSLSAETLVMEAYIRLRVVTGNVYVMQLLTDSSPTNRADWRINADRSITLRNAQTAVASSGEDQLQTLTVYRVSWRVSASGQRLRFINTQTNDVEIDLSAVLGNVEATNLRVGAIGAAEGTILDFDTVRIGDDWMAPYV